MDDYKAIARGIAEDISAGRLQPGDRLPPQRMFAYTRGIAPSTAGRVYAELTRRGLVSGETGRGTFVRALPLASRPALSEPPTATINLETNYPVLPDQQQLLAPGLSRIARSAAILQSALRDTPVRGTCVQREASARGLARNGWETDPNELIFVGNGRQALAATFSALGSAGDRVGFEALSYPVAKTLAERQGLEPVPLAMDEEGVKAEAIEAAHRVAPLRAVYLQPTVHNPLGITMSARRRTQIVAAVERLDGPILIEDTVYAFLESAAPPPLRAMAPERTILVDSLSKRIGPGLTLGFISAPPALLEPLTEAVIAGAWAAPGYALEACTRWLADGTVSALEAAKRKEAAARQAIARRIFSGCALRANPQSFHLFIDLPPNCRAAEIFEAAAAEGIAITPAAVFTVSAGHAPNAIRISLANLDRKTAAPILKRIATLIRKAAK